MKSKTTPAFRRLYASLPRHIQKRAKKSYELWKQDSQHLSLYYKNIRNNIYSVRIGLGWRALGLHKGEYMVWFWIGSHAAYNNLVNSL